MNEAVEDLYDSGYQHGAAAQRKKDAEIASSRSMPYPLFMWYVGYNNACEDIAKAIEEQA